MSSPNYIAYSSHTNIFSLPLEVTEQILVECAFYGLPEAIASFSQTCRMYFDLVYGDTDSHLWREIYLTTFDDPRPRLNILRRPTASDPAEGRNYEWMNEYQLRIRAGKLVRGTTVDPRTLASSLNALSSTAISLPPQLPDLIESPPTRDSASIAWLKRVLSQGIPPALVRRLTFRKSDHVLSIPERNIMHPGWERSSAGRAFYKLFFLIGLDAVSTSGHADEEERYNLRSRTREIEESTATEAKQRALARTVARHRVYNLPYLSADRCWGPFLRAQSPPPPPDNDDDDHLVSGISSSFKNVDGKEQEEPENSTAMLPVEGPNHRHRRTFESSTQDHNDNLVQVDMSSIRAILANFDEHDLQFLDEDEDADPDYVPGVNQYHSESDTEEHSESEFEQDATSEISFFDDDGNDGNFFAPTSGSPQIFPSRPDLVYPDWAFLSAARLVITENLRERYGSNIPMWPWFTTTAAVEATREILLRMGVPLPPESNNDGDGDEEDEDENDSKAETGGCNAENDSRSGFEALRMGSAPAFWTCRGAKEGWTGIKAEEQEQEQEMSTPWKKDKDVEFVDGWDWAGAEGRWMRAVCWMDYRDLLCHKLQTSYPRTANYHHEIEETCRVFPMTLRVVGFSRVPVPLALPASSGSYPPSKISTKSKEKGKEKANDPASPASTYDPLVYALPIIHVVGEFRGSDVNESVARRARGTVRMIGDRAIRWNLISSEVSTPERDEWVMEGVQVGDIGSAMGIVGMWTGANHERGDPIGPSWAWKME
ncbi:hypothetical protein HHX47_DHR2000655 [Lentinula edodes]|nr:hypothetical protein HHX47_DHR2000655 [Lentinula edodes]